MKKTVFALLALVFCLSACAPAATEITGEAPATVETAPAENGKTWENIPVQSDDSGWPAELTDDGRVLVNDHYDGGQPTYALISQEDYLAGSRDWTVFTDGEK